VNHIFKKFLDDVSIQEIYETQASEKDPLVAVEIDGTLSGEIIINIPLRTLDGITKKFVNKSDPKIIKSYHSDVAGELANLITGTLANQLQYADHEIRLSPPEFNDDPISMKALYENINLSFKSRFGGFDIDFYFKEE
jgi:CheY-specific phosphatase CheX